MNKRLPAILLALALMSFGCGNDDESRDNWTLETLEIVGNSPVPNHAGDRILYRSESPSPELREWVTSSGDDFVRYAGPGIQHYCWSYGGEQIAFSVADSGIFVSGPSGSQARELVWSLGEYPEFLPGDTLLVCHGPESDSANSGIFIINLTTGHRARIAEVGIEPAVSPDGQKISFLVPVLGVPGKTLYVYNRQTLFAQPLIANVYNYSWLGDSESFVFETLVDTLQRIATASMSNPAAAIYDNGTRPTGLFSDVTFVYTQIAGDSVSAVMLGRISANPIPIGDFAVNCRAAHAPVVFGQGRTQLVRLRKLD